MNKPAALPENADSVDVITMSWGQAYETALALASEIVEILKKSDPQGYFDDWLEIQRTHITQLEAAGVGDELMHKVATFHALIWSTIGKDTAPLPDFIDPEKSVIIFLTKTLTALKQPEA